MTVWKSVKVDKETYDKIIEMKIRAETVSRDIVTIREILTEVVSLALQHWDAGLAEWGIKRKMST